MPSQQPGPDASADCAGVRRGFRKTRLSKITAHCPAGGIASGSHGNQTS
jgi:hypothetical protein